MTPSTYTVLADLDTPLTLQRFMDEASRPQPPAAVQDPKPALTDKVKNKLEDGKTAVTDLVAVTSPLKDIADAVKHVHLEGNVASQSENNQLKLSDLAGLPQDLVNIFNELATWTAVAGPFLKIGLGVVAEILKIAQEVRTNKDACEDFSKKVMGIFWEFAFAAKASGCPIMTGTASALILERAIQQLRAFRAQIEVYACWGTVKRTLKRGEIKTRLDDLNKEMDALVVRVGTQNTIVLALRSDYEKVRAGASAQAKNDSPCHPDVFTQPGKASATQQMMCADAATDITAATVTIADGPTQIENSVHSNLLSAAQPGLKQVSAAVQLEIKRRNTVDGASADANTIQQPRVAAPLQPVYLMTPEESAQLKQMHDQVRRLYSPGGDGADLTGIFDNEEMAKGGDNSRYDPGQAALQLLDALCTAATSSGKDTVSQLKWLFVALGDLGLFEEAVEVATLLAALCRRKWSDVGYPRDRVNLAFVLLNLSFAFFRVGRWDEADSSSSEALAIFKDMAHREPKKYNAMLATALRSRAVHHARAGRSDQALQCTQQSIEIYRSLRLDHPDLYAIDLSAALLNYSADLSEAGRAEEALAAVEECVTMRKALDQARPAAHKAGLARALLNHSIRLSDVGKQDEALSTIEECVRLYKALYQDRPAVYEADLAKALLNFSNRLKKAGRPDEALATIEECINIRKTLYKVRPAANGADLARALNNYSNQLSEAGRHEDSLAAIQECVKMNKALYHARPAVYKADLAGALNNYSNRLSDVGEYEEALAAIEESMKMYKDLHQLRPDTYAADLAGALNNYSIQLSRAGRHGEALVIIEECVKMRKVLHEGRPKTYEADLAGALLTYSTRLSTADKHQLALTVIEDSVRMYKALHQTSPATYEEDLARAFQIYSNRLNDVGREEEALAVIEESVKMYTTLHQARPAAYDADLAEALLDYSSRLSDAGRHEESLDKVEECLKLYKVLHQARPAAYEADLAMALQHYSIELSHAGRHQEALQVIDDSLELYKRLNRRRPEVFLQRLQEAEKRADWIRTSESGLRKDSRRLGLKAFWKRTRLHSSA
ncbi:hypothetical protein OC846_005303 [Tilletia horrida]|uniref:Anaphase-promoting complex subunit 5 domain-containing protein n=1 Tax=Tilletia horrida TaxID=155126 RepID=A0AAN6JW47_9BASI|nr:hypothetical protein OC845_005540 [Tilletia horrida]KAK0546370.1 hypothetical protein OC846_005303 [Tilletia horrida]KAK0562105.1 hypothetical protein OC861_005492 [Tilletia horrida]